MLRSSLFRFVGYLLALCYLSEHLTIISLICQFRIHYYFSFVNIQEKSTFISNKKECELIIKEWKTFSVWGIDQTLSKMFPDISNPTLSGKIVFLWRIINFQKIYSEERYILDISTHRRLTDCSGHHHWTALIIDLQILTNFWKSLYFIICLMTSLKYFNIIIMTSNYGASYFIFIPFNIFLLYIHIYYKYPLSHYMELGNDSTFYR